MMTQEEEIEMLLQERDERIASTSRALELISAYGAIDGAHHKQWVINQILRALLITEEAYQQWVTEYEAGEDGPKTYEWNEGIAP